MFFFIEILDIKAKTDAHKQVKADMITQVIRLLFHRGFSL